jgi:hypothetical protein
MATRPDREGLFDEITAPTGVPSGALDEKDLEARKRPLDRAETAALAPRIATLAILSNNVYERAAPIPLPRGWEVAVPPRDGKGLSYAVYVHSAAGRVDEAVLAYRGTDDLRDWAQNLRLTDEQTVEGDQVFREFADRYRREGVGKISVTGHSLGGGLALRMSFLAEGAPATVFNWAPFSPPQDSQRADHPRVCVWEKNEVLAFVRAKQEKPAIAWDGTRLIRVNFSHASTDRQHKMEPLARSLVMAAAPYDADLREVERNLP